jgi:hypothetical protein
MRPAKDLKKPDARNLAKARPEAAEGKTAVARRFLETVSWHEGSGLDQGAIQRYLECSWNGRNGWTVDKFSSEAAAEP